MITQSQSGSAADFFRSLINLLTVTLVCEVCGCFSECLLQHFDSIRCRYLFRAA